MKKIKTRTNSPSITRREFVGRALAAGLVSGAPAFLRGQNLNNKLNIAFIACGGRGNASPAELTVVPGQKPGRDKKRAAPPHPGPPTDADLSVLFDVEHPALDSPPRRH